MKVGYRTRIDVIGGKRRARDGAHLCGDLRSGAGRAKICAAKRKLCGRCADTRHMRAGVGKSGKGLGPGRGCGSCGGKYWSWPVDKRSQGVGGMVSVKRRAWWRGEVIDADVGFAIDGWAGADVIATGANMDATRLTPADSVSC